MVSINYSSREVCCKIVYYGPGLSGKTTNLQYVHSKVPGNTRGDLISLATESDRTLYFDFLPINIGTINGFAAKFQLYTVPGQVYYNATRKLVLRGVDGVVFVADSQPDKLDENIESLMNLQENLEEYGYDIDDMPLVIQYNKRDLPGVMPVEELRAKLNPMGRADFGASATVGNGVFDTLKMIIKLVLDKAKSVGGADAQAAAKPVQATAVEPEPETPSRPYPTAEPADATQDSSSSVSSGGTAVSTATASAATGPGRVPMAASAQPKSLATDSPVGSADDQESVQPSRVEPVSQPEDADASRTVENEAPEPVAIRPFPGSRDESSPRKITPTAFAPTQQESESESLYERNVLKTAGDGINTGSTGCATPGMAPPLRRRAQQRKRGFFKRLFGIK
jgi:hypothetical protein